jgi:hypothetical protein
VAAWFGGSPWLSWLQVMGCEFIWTIGMATEIYKGAKCSSGFNVVFLVFPCTLFASPSQHICR